MHDVHEISSSMLQAYCWKWERRLRYFFTMAKNRETAKSVILSGSLLILTGLIQGVFIHSATYPRIALSAHIQMTSEGVMTVAAGLLLGSPDFCQLSAVSHKIVAISHYCLWLQCGSEVIGAYTGAADTLKIATEEGGSGSASPEIEAAIGLFHFGPGVLLVVGWALLAYGVWQANPSNSNDKKED